VSGHCAGRIAAAGTNSRIHIYRTVFSRFGHYEGSLAHYLPPSRPSATESLPAAAGGVLEWHSATRYCEYSMPCASGPTADEVMRVKSVRNYCFMSQSSGITSSRLPATVGTTASAGGQGKAHTIPGYALHDVHAQADPTGQQHSQPEPTANKARAEQFVQRECTTPKVNNKIQLAVDACLSCTPLH
jgi:hypothetical protein